MIRQAALTGLLALVVLAFGHDLEAGNLNISIDSLLAVSDSLGIVDSTTLPSTDFALLYFHRTYRCETCLEMERRIREVLRDMGDELPDTERFVFRDLDYESEDNRDLVERYEIDAIMLAMVEQEEDRISDWHVFGNIWDHEDAVEFKKYVHDELRDYFSLKREAEESSQAKMDGE